jgi:hypothetical protein
MGVFILKPHRTSIRFTKDVTGFAPGQWSWASATTGGVTATLSITGSGVYTVNLLMREDGLRIDRLLLTTDTAFIPTGFGPATTALASITTPLTRTIVYTYDDLYRLTEPTTRPNLRVRRSAGIDRN